MDTPPPGVSRSDDNAPRLARPHASAAPRPRSRRTLGGELRACSRCARVRGDVARVAVGDVAHFVELWLCAICVDEIRRNDPLVIVEDLREGAA